MHSRIQKAIHYEAVQVVRRTPDGALEEYRPGEAVTTEREARAKAVRLAKESYSTEGAEYQVIRVTVDALPRAYKRKAGKAGKGKTA